MSGLPITGRSVWPTAVLVVVLLLAGVGVAARSEGPVSDLLAALAGANEQPRAAGSADAPAPNASDDEPGDADGGAEPTDGDDAGEPADASAEPNGEAEAPACQAPPLPPIPSEAVELAEGCIELRVGPGEERVVDGHAIVREAGAQPPACAAFGSHFSWQVTDEPPSAVELTAVRQGARYHLAEGTVGDASGMCGTVSITNPASTAATLDLRYVLLDCRPTGQAC